MGENYCSNLPFRNEQIDKTSGQLFGDQCEEHTDNQPSALHGSEICFEHTKTDGTDTLFFPCNLLLYVNNALCLLHFIRYFGLFHVDGLLWRMFGGIIGIGGRHPQKFPVIGIFQFIKITVHGNVARIQ